MKIGIMHFRAGETDGVSLEMDKWKKTCNDSGHNAFLIAGSGGDYNHPSISYREKETLDFFDKAFKELTLTEKELKEKCSIHKERAKSELKKILIETETEHLIVNNICSLPLNIPLSIAIFELKAELNIKITGFHHDFYWERDIYNPTCSFITDILNKYFPSENLDRHLVINKIAEKSLLEKKGLNSIIVANYWDFEKNYFVEDEYNQNLKNDIGIKKDAIMILQGTRLVKRKGIEFALAVVSKMKEIKSDYYGRKLSDNRVISEDTEIEIIFPGLNEDEEYVDHLKMLHEKYDLKKNFISEKCTHSREENTYSLWDFYVNSDLVTYPSIYEGWGNQLVEAIAALKPVIIFEYPVYITDIKPLGFNLISLGNKYSTVDGENIIRDEIVLKAARESFEILTDNEKLKTITLQNYKIAEKHLSLGSLGTKIKEII